MEIKRAMMRVKQFIIAGLRIEATRDGEYTVLVVRDAEGKVVFRGVIILRAWPKIKNALNSINGKS